VKTPNQILQTTIEPISKTCRECGKEFKIELPFPIKFADLIKVCSECTDRHTQMETRAIIARAEQARLGRWERLCPPEFRETVIAQLPKPDLVKRVLAWKYGKRGLLIHGETRTGKSRCAWLLLKRECEARRSIIPVDSMTLGVDYPARFSVSCEEVATWVHRLCDVDILFLDDPFKVKLTERVEELIFTVLNKRMESQKPIIMTSNDTGKSLIPRLSPDRGAPLVERLREYCQPIFAGSVMAQPADLTLPL
jgi:hypothetical protein